PSWYFHHTSGRTVLHCEAISALIKIRADCLSPAVPHTFSHLVAPMGRAGMLPILGANTTSSRTSRSHRRPEGGFTVAVSLRLGEENLKVPLANWEFLPILR